MWTRVGRQWVRHCTHVCDAKRQVHLERFMINLMLRNKSTNVSVLKAVSGIGLLCWIRAYLDGLLALVERGTDLALLRLVGGGGHLGLELGLERPAKTQKQCWKLIMSKSDIGIGSHNGFAYRLASVRSSARAFDHDPNSAGVMETVARERSRTLICERRQTGVSIMQSCTGM